MGFNGDLMGFSSDLYGIPSGWWYTYPSEKYEFG